MSHSGEQRTSGNDGQSRMNGSRMRRGLTRETERPSLIAFGGGLRGLGANGGQPTEFQTTRQDRVDGLRGGDMRGGSKGSQREMQGNLLGQSFSDPISSSPPAPRTFSMVKSAPEAWKSAAPVRLMRTATQSGSSFMGANKLRGLEEFHAKQRALRASGCGGPSFSASSSVETPWNHANPAHFGCAYPEKTGFSMGLRFAPDFKRASDVSGHERSLKTHDTSSFSPVAASPAPMVVESDERVVKIEVYEADMPISLYNVFDLKMEAEGLMESKEGEAKFIWTSIKNALISTVESGLKMDWKIVETSNHFNECFGRLYDQNRELVEFQISLFRLGDSFSPIYMEIRRMAGDFFVHDEFVNILTNALKQTNDEFANLTLFKRDDHSDEFMSDNEMDFEMDLKGSMDEDGSVMSESINDADFEDLPALGELPMPGPLTSLNGMNHGSMGMSIDHSFDSKEIGTEDRFGLTAQECVETLMDTESYRDELREASMTLNGLVNDIRSRSQWVIGPLFTEHDGVQLCHHLVDPISSPRFMDAHTSWHTMQAVFGLVKNDLFPTLILASTESDVSRLIDSVKSIKNKWVKGNDLVFPSQSIVHVCDSVLNRVRRLAPSLYARQ